MGSRRWMTRRLVWFASTMFPTSTRRCPARPSMGDVTVQYSRLSRAVSTAASFCLTRASPTATAFLLASKSCWEMAVSARSFSGREKSSRARSSVAFVWASVASAAASCAWNGRESILKRRSPALTSAPSWNPISRIRPVSCGWIVTISRATVRPISSRYTGTSSATAAIAVTGVGNSGGGPVFAASFFWHPDPAISRARSTACVDFISLLLVPEWSGEVSAALAAARLGRSPQARRAELDELPRHDLLVLHRAAAAGEALEVAVARPGVDERPHDEVHAPEEVLDRHPRQRRGERAPELVGDLAAPARHEVVHARVGLRLEPAHELDEVRRLL